MMWIKEILELIKINLEIIIAVSCIILFGFVPFCLIIHQSLTEPYNPARWEYVSQEEKLQENCEHEYVITSKFSPLTFRYKVISKCTKCGKEI